MPKKVLSKNFHQWRGKGVMLRSSASEYAYNLNQHMSGCYNWNWKGGITPMAMKIRASRQYVEWRNKVFSRDLYTCQKCGSKDGGRLNAHHIRPFALLLKEVDMLLLSKDDDLEANIMAYPPVFDVNNGITYCVDCHTKYHKALRAKERAILKGEA